MPALAEAGKADGAAVDVDEASVVDEVDVDEASVVDEVDVDKASVVAELEIRIGDTLNKDPIAVGLEEEV
ncbi:hypothetical protein MMC22_007080 [Lobaria immixta]|nr:hypothetical protein [Lobaria immixta]